MSKSEKVVVWKVAYFRAYYLTDQQSKEWDDKRVEEEISGWVGGDPFNTTTAVAYRRGWEAAILTTIDVELDTGKRFQNLQHGDNWKHS